MKVIKSIHMKNYSEETELQNEIKIKNSNKLFKMMAVLSLILVIFEIAFNINLLIPPLIICFIGWWAYIMQIYNIQGKKYKQIDFILFYVLITPTIFTIIIFPIELLLDGVILTIIKVILLISIYISTVFYRKNYKKKEFYMKYSAGEIEELLHNDSGAHILGKNVKTGEPTAIPLNDRFVHLLIIGATGTGKSSQILLPMINQDLQNKELGSIIIEPKGDLAEKAYQLALHYGRTAIYFNPMLNNCPYFNPLSGNEDDVIENLSSAFRMLDPDSSMFFQNQAENLIRKSLKVLKRLYGNDATLIDLNTLIWNTDNEGRKILIEFNKKVKPEHMKSENDELYHWFMSDYFTGSTGEKNSTKTFEHTSGIRTQIFKLCSNKYLRKVLNPPKGIGSEVDFIKALANCEVICIGTAQGDLQQLGSYLGYFLILQLQSAVFKRPGDERTREPCVLTIDEFQVFANPAFGNMLTQGRSYRVPCVLATQNIALIGMNSGRQGKDFAELVKTNARNIVVFPGCNYQDADYFSKLFGEDIVQVEKKAVSADVYNPFLGWNLKAPKENISYSDEKKVRFTPTDIINMKYQEILCRLINKNAVMPATKAKVEYLDKELNDEMDKRVYKYRELYMIHPEDEDLYKESEFGEEPNVNHYIIDDEYFDFKDDETPNTGASTNGNIILGTDDEDDL